MPSLANHQSNDFVKALLIGNAMAGKTGSMASLAKAGYKLRILDLDNKLDVLKYFVQHECPEALGNIEFRTIRDKYRATPGGAQIEGKPKAWVEALKMCDRWKYDDVDLGVPATWGSDTILVIDSLSRLCDAAYDFHEAIIPRGKSGDYDGRAVYGNAQDDVEKFLAMLTSAGMQVNVLVTCHVTFQDMPDGTKKGFPQGVGQKLSPRIPQYFPSAVLYENKMDKRSIRTTSSPLIDLANPAPFAMAPSFPLETGLADFFAVLRDPPGAERPKELKLVRRV